MLHAWTHAFRGRKEKKRMFRQLWNVKINAAIREEGMNYSTFIAALKKKNIKIDRKILADLAEHEPEVFKKVVAAVKKVKNEAVKHPLDISGFCLSDLRVVDLFLFATCL